MKFLVMSSHWDVLCMKLNNCLRNIGGRRLHVSNGRPTSKLGGTVPCCPSESPPLGPSSLAP